MIPETPGADAPDSPEDPLSASPADSCSFLVDQTISPYRPSPAARSRNLRPEATTVRPTSKAKPAKISQSVLSDVPVGHLMTENCLVNLAGDYRYLKAGYYASQDFESSGEPIRPTCSDIMDAYVVPLFLAKAQKAGLTVPSYYISNGYFEPPVVVDTINPFMSRHSVVLKTAAQERISKSLTRNFTYAICCQDLPDGSRVSYFPAVLGHTAQPRYRELARALWDVFHIPVVKVRVIMLPDGTILPSGMQPLPYARLTERDRAIIEREVLWLK